MKGNFDRMKIKNGCPLRGRILFHQKTWIGMGRQNTIVAIHLDNRVG